MLPLGSQLHEGMSLHCRGNTHRQDRTRHDDGRGQGNDHPMTRLDKPDPRTRQEGEGGRPPHDPTRQTLPSEKHWPHMWSSWALTLNCLSVSLYAVCRLVARLPACLSVFCVCLPVCPSVCRLTRIPAKPVIAQTDMHTDYFREDQT